MSPLTSCWQPRLFAIILKGPLSPLNGTIDHFEFHFDTPIYSRLDDDVTNGLRPQLISSTRPCLMKKSKNMADNLVCPHWDVVVGDCSQQKSKKRTVFYGRLTRLDYSACVSATSLAWITREIDYFIDCSLLTRHKNRNQENTHTHREYEKKKRKKEMKRKRKIFLCLAFW